MLKVCVCGSRTFDDIHYMAECLDAILPQDEEVIIVSGKAIGADTLGEMYAAGRGLKVDPYPVTNEEWTKFGKRAGHLRNERMLANCDLVVAFYDGRSPGTTNMIDIARKAGKLWEVFRFSTDSDYPF